MIQTVEPTTLEAALDLWQVVCRRLSLPFSAIAIREALADACLNHPSPALDEHALVATGSSLALRIRRANGDLSEMIDAAVEAAPLLVPVQLEASESHPDSVARQGTVYAVILERRSRSRFLVHLQGQTQTVTRKWLKQHAAKSPESEYVWYQAQSVESQKTGGMSPVRRLLRFLKPESGDMRTIFIFSLIVGILSLTTPLAVEALVNTIAFGRYLQPLLVLALMVFIFLLFQAGLRLLLTIIVEVMQRRIFVRVVDDLAYRLTRVPLPHWGPRFGPELVNRFFDVVTVQKVVSKLLLESLMLVLQTVIGLTVLAFYHPFLLGYDIGLLFMMTVVMALIGRGAAKTAKAESTIKYETAAWLQELARHPAMFRFSGGMEFAVNRADELATQYVRNRRDHFLIVLRQVGFALVMQAIAATVLLGLGGYLVIEGQMNLGQLVAAELIVTVILGSFTKIGKDLESLYDLLAAMDKLGYLYDLPIEEGPLIPRTRRDRAASIRLVDLPRSGGREPYNVDIQPGQTVAIYGRSGTGKSRLLDLISGQATPRQGYVLLDDLRVDLLGAEGLQTRMAFVNGVEIFAGTMEENLRMGHADIDTESVVDVLQSLGLIQSIYEMEKGVQTEVNVTGYPLNNRQAVLLVLARALLLRPGAVLIDGILDTLPDDDLPEILEGLRQFAGTTTLVIVTGRKLVADWADQVVPCE